MAAELTARFPEAEIELMPSRGGRFEVTCNSVPIFEKSRLKRHAEPGEIVDLITRAVS